MHAPATIVYKISTARAWQDAEARGAFSGSDDDRRDGFIHLSSEHQVPGTLAKHFHGQTDLVLVAIDAAHLGQDLKWEVSRGGEPFPHLYGTLDPRHALWVRPLPANSQSLPASPEGHT